MKTIVVNATALDVAGALSILRQFIEAIPEDNEREYIIFVSPIVHLHTTNPCVRLVPVEGVKSLIKRFLWDALGVKKWLKNNNIIPSVAISLQNTNFRTGYKIPNYIYYHQSIPFYKHRWSLFKSKERTLWFYKHIYPFFVKIFLNKQTEIFVQLEFIKDGFVRRFGIDPTLVHIIRPKIADTTQSLTNLNFDIDQNKINLFYPASPFFYKNHKVLIDALFLLENSNFCLYLTCKKEDLNYPTPKNVKFTDTLTFEQVISMYKECDAVVFPSYIETFGLPLIESAATACPIIASDLEYSQEVLKGYDGAVFVDYDRADLWLEAIKKLEKGKRFKPFELTDQQSWSQLFEIINKKNQCLKTKYY